MIVKTFWSKSVPSLRPLPFNKNLISQLIRISKYCIFSLLTHSCLLFGKVGVDGSIFSSAWFSFINSGKGVVFYCVSGCHNFRIKHNKQFQLACFYLLLPDICGIFNKDMKYHIFGLGQKDARLWLLVDAIWSQDWALISNLGYYVFAKPTRIVNINLYLAQGINKIMWI